jgi:hypothetical protein
MKIVVDPTLQAIKIFFNFKQFEESIHLYLLILKQFVF